MNARTKTRLAIWIFTMYVICQIVFGSILSVEFIPDGYGGAQLLVGFALLLSDMGLLATLISQIESWQKD